MRTKGQQCLGCAGSEGRGVQSGLVLRAMGNIVEGVMVCWIVLKHRLAIGCVERRYVYIGGGGVGSRGRCCHSDRGQPQGVMDSAGEADVCRACFENGLCVGACLAESMNRCGSSEMGPRWQVF